jgi:hypothetical protein
MTKRKERGNMPEQITAWTREEIAPFIWDILDSLKKLDETSVKEWVKQNWEDPDEIYS